MRRLLLLASGSFFLLAVHPTPGTAGTSAVRIDGPTVVRGWTMLRATTSVPPQRVAAITLRIGGRPLGTDTTAPYEILIDGSSLHRGPQRAALELVRRDGTRVRSALRIDVVAADRRRELSASPRRGFERARRALARGNVTVRLAPGRYPVSVLRLGRGARLVGSGPATVLAAPSGAYWGVVIVDGDNALLSGLTVDGGGSGAGEGQSVVVQSGVSRFVARRLALVRVRKVGVYAWGKLDDVSVQDSSIASAGRADAGVIAALQTGDDLSVVRTRVAGFRQFGINFIQVPHDNRRTGLRALALDNVVTDIDAPEDTDGRTKGGIWSGGAQAAIIGNVVRRTGSTGIETVGSSHGVSIVANRISETPVGIYLEHSTTRSVIARNFVRRVRTGINVEWEYGGVGSGENVFRENHVVGATAVGLFIDVGADGNRVVANRFDAAVTGIVLQGSSHNHILRNLICRAPAAVAQLVGLWDDRRPAPPVANRLDRNRRTATCAK